MAKIVQGERNGKLSLLKFDNAEPPPVLWKDSANYVEPTYHGGLVHIFLDKKTKKHTFFYKTYFYSIENVEGVLKYQHCFRRVCVKNIITMWQ